MCEPAPNLIRPSRRAPAAWLCAWCLLAGSLAPAAEPTDAERRAVATANVALSDDPAYAEKLYTEFLTQFSDSPLRAEAVLGQAQAMNRQGKFDAALAVLRDNQARAGVLGDQYDFWIGENLIAKGELEQAEAAFGGLIVRYPESTNVLAASVRQAFAVYRRKDYERTVALLADPAGAFERARIRQPAASQAINGLLFLAESRFELKRFVEVEATIALLPSTNLNARSAWRRTALLARVFSATNRAAEGQGLMGEVLKLAKATNDPELMAESNALQGAILEQLNRPAEALAAYEPNLLPEVPAAWRGQALARVVTLAQVTGGPGAAVQKLELLSAQGLDEAARDLVQLTLGELRLRMFYDLPPAERTSGQPSPAGSNLLAAALGNFTNVINSYSNSPYVGRAWLDGGWCHWELTNWLLAVESFGQAASRLPAGLDQAKAVFKLADSQFLAGQYEAALTNYARLVRDHGALPEVKEGLLDQAYYQMITAAIQTGNQAEAEFAMKALLEQFPGSFHGVQGVLLVGQHLSEVREPARARAIFEKLADRFQNSSLAPERELAIARTYELESKWAEAAGVYGRWLETHTNHASRATAEFGRAFALYGAQDLTNALAGFTNFVSRFPQSDLAPKAFVWLGNHYDNTQEFNLAELNYQQLFAGPHTTNWPVTRLTWEAQILASRSALARQLHNDARRYLTNLVNTPGCPGDIRAEGFFALGDVFAADSSMEGDNRFGYAATAFKRLINEFPDSPLVAVALGRTGECSLQLRAYDEAASAFLACMQHASATVADRSRAEIGLGLTMEKKAEALPPADQAPLLDAARDHYLNVFFQRNIRTERGEVADPQWLQQACVSAARLAERRRDWLAAARLYERLREMLPVLKDYCEPLIRQLEERARQGG